MSVPKGKRTQSRFEASHQFYKLRDAVTELMLRDFGFSMEKYEAQVERYKQIHQGAENLDAVVERWAAKAKQFDRWFIDKECEAVLEILRRIESEFTWGNSIYPSDTPARFVEYCERRRHIDNAIAQCYVLKQELQYIIRTLPVDLNKYTRFAKAIDAQIALYKGVRQADNKNIRKKRDKPQKQNEGKE